MAWTVKQQIADPTNIETQWGIVNDGTYVYSVGHGFNAMAAQTYMVTEKRQISDGTLTWQKGSWTEHEEYGFCVAQDGTRVFAAGWNRTHGFGLIRSYTLAGGTSWSYNPTTVGAGVCGYYNAVDVDDDYVYLVGPDGWTGDFHVEGRNKSTGAQVWFSAVGSGNDESKDVRVYDGYVYACGQMWDGVGGYTPRVVRVATDGTFDWGITDITLAVSTYGYAKLDVDSTGIYIASLAHFAEDSFTLRKLALADGSVSWSITVAVALSGAISSMGTVSDVLILGTKVYIVYGCDVGLGTQYVIESRNTSDGSLVAYDSFTEYVEVFKAITGLSNAPTADEIVAVGNYPQTDPSYTYSYWNDFLAATGGGSGSTLTLSLADVVIFSDVKSFAIGLPLSDGIILSDSKSYGMSKPLSDGIVVSETATATLRGIWTKICNLISSDIWIKFSKSTKCGSWIKKVKSSGPWVKR